MGLGLLGVKVAKLHLKGCNALHELFFGHPVIGAPVQHVVTLLQVGFDEGNALVYK